MVTTEGNYSQESWSGPGQSREIFLPPTTDAIEPIIAQASRKRKLNEVEYGNSIGEAFIIKSHPSLPSPQAQKLIPRLQLPRSCLPFAYLDPLGGQDDPLGSRLFSAHMDIFEKNMCEDQPPSLPTILIAQSAIDDNVFAIDRVRKGVYAICRLAHWVGLDMLERLRPVSIKIEPPENRRRQEHSGLLGDEWWKVAAIESASNITDDQSGTLGIEAICGVRLCLQPARQKSHALDQITQGTTLPIPQDQTGNELTEMVKEVAQNSEEVFKLVRAQYQEALYASKLSLAYFAKGPLSRARAAFSSPDGFPNNYSHLISFLRSCILPLATMDIKYREALPEVVKGLPFDLHSDDECTNVIGMVSKRTRKSKKSNVGKNGLYVGEEVNIAQWWLGRDLSSVVCDSVDAKEEAVRSAVLEQRARETQMQIILSLEILALESLATSQPVENSPPMESIAGDDGSQKRKKKPKKPQDLSMLLDLLVDRLCIWQSMTVDEMKTSNGENRSACQPAAKSTANMAGKDHLRQFCVDVVLPFYGARLPDLTTLLCQKLGGPKQTPPRRPPLAKSASSHASLKPGVPVQRQQNRKHRRTLERVLTDERFASQKPPPSLSRSATDPVLPQVKREVSDTSLSSIPLNRVAMHKRYSQREVDFHTRSQATEAKLKKKARVEQELQGAIAALKRPNPRMAVKELVEEAEKRAAASNSRKPKNPVRNHFAQGAQVMATPSNNRHKDVYGGLPRPGQSEASLRDLEEIPPSSISCVPSSSKKPAQSPLLAPDSTRKTGSSVMPTAETPTKVPSRLCKRPPISTSGMNSVIDVSHLSPLLEASMPPKASHGSHTSNCRPLQVHETPSKCHRLEEVDPHQDVIINATPNKAPPVASEPAYNASKAVLSPLWQEKEKSIYVALGWDDEIDELL